MAKPKLKIRRVKTAMFNGHRYRVYWRKPRQTKKEAKKHKGEVTYGMAHLGPTHRALYFSPDSKLHPTPKDLHSTLIHECAHASFPQLDEESILGFELDFTRFLERIGLKIVLA